MHRDKHSSLLCKVVTYGRKKFYNVTAWLIRATTDVETNVVAVERLKEFDDTPKEADWEVATPEIDEKWPSLGEIEFQDYSLKYRSGTSSSS